MRSSLEVLGDELAIRTELHGTVTSLSHQLVRRE